MSLGAPLVLSCFCLAACATAETEFGDGQRAFNAGQLEQSISVLETFARYHCHRIGADPWCGDAVVMLAEAHLRSGDPDKACQAIEYSRYFSAPDAATVARLENIEKRARAEFASGLKRSNGEATVAFDLESRTLGDFSLRARTLWLDLVPIRLGEAQFRAGVTVDAVPPRTVSAGDHQVDVIAVFDCETCAHPGYRFTVASHWPLVIRNGEVVSVAVDVFELPDWTNRIEALSAHMDIHRGVVAPSRELDSAK